MTEQQSAWSKFKIGVVWVRTRPLLRYTLLLTASVIYLVVGHWIDDGSFLELLFDVVILGIVVVIFPWHRISLERIRQSTPLWLSLLVVFLAGTGTSMFILDQGILAEAVMLVAVFCGLLVALANRG